VTHGAKVYMGARSESKALTAINEIKQQAPEASVEFLPLDLASFASVVAAAKKLRGFAHRNIYHFAVHD
jgi:hypothetical protein